MNTSSSFWQSTSEKKYIAQEKENGKIQMESIKHACELAARTHSLQFKTMPG